MPVKPQLRMVLSIVVFVMAAALTYLGVTQWRPRAESQTTRADDTIAGIDGLREGESVSFPEMRTLSGEPAALGNAAAEKFLFVFFTPSCEGCSLDATLWKSLNAQWAHRSTMVYLIDVGNDRAALDKFIEAYDLASLPILVSEAGSVGQMLRVNIVPQYLLIAKSGKVLHRWDGVQSNKPPLVAYENKD